MRFFSYLSKGQARSARVIDQLGIDINIASKLYKQSQNNSSSQQLDVLPVDLLDLFRLGDDGQKAIATVTDWVAQCYKQKTININAGVLFDFKKAHLMAPIIRPGKVICIAGNFPALNKMGCPEYPTVFLKPSGGVIGHLQSILIPPICESVAYEVELAIVIGRQCKNLKVEEVTSVIAGYTLANDLGDRLLEKRTSQWTSGKMFDTFTPMGPIVLTKDELGDVNNLKMLTKVNDQIVQENNTSQMFFDVPHLVAYLSTLTTLDCGDVILTGSPKLMDNQANPVCDLKSGDVIEISIEGMGSLINPIIAENQVI
jgi:2-keto-4-pentenoate hydratase/2-oxohepta-3-ene-1,7-dioic acid hydratase in catechol pathway